MKIAIIGSHGTFKTTLSYFLAGVLKSRAKTVGIVDEVAGSCPYLKQGRGDFIAQNWIMLTQIQREREKQDQNEYIVCDRSIIDNFVYTLDLFQSSNTPLPEWMEPFTLAHAKSYNFIFKTPLTRLGLVKDGVRNTEYEWQEKIDKLLLKFLKDHDIKYISLPAVPEGNPGEVIDYAIRQAMFMARKITDMDIQTSLV
ncbi:MAG: ATP-binding protein [archaeon]